MNKDGFSLVESMVSLLIMSVLIMTAMTVMTVKRKALISISANSSGTGNSTASVIDCSNNTSQPCIDYAATTILDCNSGTASACYVAYQNNWNRYSVNNDVNCTQLTTVWPGRPSGNYNLTTSATTWVASGCGRPLDPVCTGYASNTTTIGAIKVSMCNNSANLTANGVSNSGAAQCWQGLSTASCTGTGCGTDSNYKILCNHAGAVNACTALNGGVDWTVGTTNYNWRLPTQAELTTIGDTSANRTATDICDQTSGYPQPYCATYGGCNSSDTGCYPAIVWSETPSTSGFIVYRLIGGSWSGPLDGSFANGFSARCVRNKD